MTKNVSRFSNAIIHKSINTENSIKIEFQYKDHNKNIVYILCKKPKTISVKSIEGEGIFSVDFEPLTYNHYEELDTKTMINSMLKRNVSVFDSPEVNWVKGLKIIGETNILTSSKNNLGYAECSL